MEERCLPPGYEEVNFGGYEVVVAPNGEMIARKITLEDWYRLIVKNGGNIAAAAAITALSGTDVAIKV